MENNKFLYKITHNKILLFIIPNLIYMSNLLNYYNVNFKGLHEVLFSEVIILSLVFLFITWIIYLLLGKILKDKQKIFCILSFVCIFYSFKFTLIYFLIFIAFTLLLILEFKKFITFKLDNFICIISFIILFLFIYNFTIASINVIYMVTHSKSYDNNITVNVEEETETPNIYWIHCDGMMGIDAMNKYFRYNNKYLIDYFNNNSFFLQNDATLVAGHHTQKALVALFNPYYYDNFFKEYLSELENNFIDANNKPDFIVDYYELEEKRLNSELFMALEEKDYTTVAIAEFNPYTSLYTDYFYDYYYFGYDIRHIDSNNSDLKLLKDTNNNKLLSYIRFTHLKGLAYRTMLYNVVGNANYLNYDIVDYNSFDSSNYKYIDNAMNKSNYWLSKAILKGLDDSFKIDHNKFVFVDFKSNHDPYTFDREGNIIDASEQYAIPNYLGNYIYSSYLLVDMLEFIKDNDENAIIIVQADHGLHTATNEAMLNQFYTNIDGVQEIRNSVISAYYIPDKYKNGDEKYLDNPLNISRYIVNSYIGQNYEYIE